MTALIRRNFLLAAKKCQLVIGNEPYTWLGIQFESQIASIPENTRRTLTTMASPKSQRCVMKILGLLNFYSSLIVSLRHKTRFLSDKLKKSNQGFSWSEDDEARYRRLLSDASDSHMPGLLALFSPTQEHRRVYCQTDWAQSSNSSSMIVYVKFKEGEKTRLCAAACDSRVLPESYRDKSSVLGELASATFSAVALRSLLLWVPWTLFTDSIALVFLFANRFNTKSVITNKQFQRLVIAMQPFSFVCRFLPSAAMEQSADVISRFEKEKQMPLNQFLTTLTCLEDFEKLDSLLRPDRQEEDDEQFLLRQQKNSDLLLRIENARGMDEEEIVHYFSKTMHLPKDMQEIVNEIESTPEDSLEADKKTWKENFAFNVKMDDPSDSAVLQVVEETNRISAEEVKDQPAKSDVDYFTQIMPSNEVTELTKEGMAWTRRDAASIANCKVARDVMLNPTEEHFPLGFARSSTVLGDWCYTINYIYHHTLSTENNIPDEPLFNDFDEVKRALDYARLSEEIASMYEHFKAIQSRNDTIQTVIQLVEKKLTLDDVKVDGLRRLDDLAKKLIDGVEGLVVYKGLLFKLRLPKRGEHCYALLVLPELDAERFCLRLHVAGHRSVMHLYAMASCKIYTEGLADICQKVVRSCFHCSTWYSYQKPNRCVLPNYLVAPGAIWSDIKGPYLTNKGTKKWVLVVLDSATGYHSLGVLNNMTAKELANCMFSTYIKSFGVPIAIHTDLGSSYTSEIARELYTILGIMVRFSSTSNPKSNKAEGAVNRFSKCLKQILGGESVLAWESKIALTQLVLNSMYLHPYSQRSPMEMFCGHPYSNLYSPFVLFETSAEKQMTKVSQDRVALLRSIVAAIRKEHKVFLSVAVNPARTVHSLNLNEGSAVFYRVYKHPHLVDGIGSLLPKFLPGVITKVISKTTVMIRSDVTKKLVNRHVSDIHPQTATSRFVSTETGEQGFRRRMTDMTSGLEAGRELDDESTQLTVLEHTKNAVENAENRARTNNDLQPSPPQEENDQPAVRPKQPTGLRRPAPSAERRSRRLQGKQPEYY